MSDFIKLSVFFSGSRDSNWRDPKGMGTRVEMELQAHCSKQVIWILTAIVRHFRIWLFIVNGINGLERLKKKITLVYMQTKCPHFTGLMGKNELYFSCITGEDTGGAKAGSW